jgi:3-dehydroquinate synthase
MNKFIIDSIEFNCSEELLTNIDISSNPYNYTVKFMDFIPNFKDNDFLIIDKNIQKIYNISHHNMMPIDATENNKSIETVLKICEWLSNKNFNKGNILYVIGGGITQDIGAFVGSMYKRGINWIYVPTTLLSQCDSCIGGKTALNFNQMKNQLALFSAPRSVIIDTNFLQSLTQKEILSGMGEVVKFFIIAGEPYISLLDNISLKEKIFHSLIIKKTIVEYDEFEKNIRKSLNYGHSFGHAIESASNYAIPHGEAVILGIEIINQLFGKSEQITSIVNKFTSLEKIKNINPDLVMNYLKHDKKMQLNTISLIVVESPGITKFVPTILDDKLMKKIYEIFIN